MQTKLKIKSSYSVDEVDFNSRLTKLVSSLIGKKSYEVEFITDEKCNVSCPCFVVIYDNSKDLKEIIRILNGHKYDPIEGYDDILANDFSISLENDIIDESFEYLTSKNFDYLEEQINLLDYICSDIVSEQEDLKTKVEALYVFFEKSGILHYKQTIEALLNTLEKNGVLNKSSVQETIFKKIH